MESTGGYLRQRRGVCQVSYAFPRRIFDGRVYPRKSLNGYNVLVCGSTNGLVVMWVSRGEELGRSMGKQGGSELNNELTENLRWERQNDDENYQSVLEQLKDEDLRDLGETPFIIQYTHHIPLSTDVLQIALPNFDAGVNNTGLIEQNLIAVMVCADGTLRILSMPIEPPSKNETDCITLVDITGRGTPNFGQIPYVISITFALRRISPSSASLHGVPLKGDSNDSMKLLNDKSLSLTAKEELQREVIIAICSTKSNSTLYLYRMPIYGNSQKLISSGAQVFHKLPIINPVVRIEFADGTFHRYLLIAERNGFIRIYNPFVDINTDDNDEMFDDDENSIDTRGFRTNGPWIAHYMVPTGRAEESTKLTYTNCSGKPISPGPILLDARWTGKGSCIMTLFSTGEWGVWKIKERCEPESFNEIDMIKFKFGPLKENHVALQSPDFILRGYLFQSSSKTSNGKSPVATKATIRSLAPMTPNTRKSRQASLFGETSNFAPTRARGRIQVRSSLFQGDSFCEKIVIQYAEKVYSVPSLTSLYTRENFDDQPHNESGGLDKSGIGPLTAVSLCPVSQIDMQGDHSCDVDILHTEFDADPCYTVADLCGDKSVGSHPTWNLLLVGDYSLHFFTKTSFSRNTGSSSVPGTLLPRTKLRLGNTDYPAVPHDLLAQDPSPNFPQFHVNTPPTFDLVNL